MISPYQIGAVQMAQTALRPAVVDFVELATSSDNLELAMEEITIVDRIGAGEQSLLDANLRQRFGVIVVGIQRQDRRMEFNPEPDTAIRAGDKLVVLGRPDSLKQLEAEAAALMPARVLDGDGGRPARSAPKSRPPSRRSPREAGRPPGLGIVLVGDDPASEIYVRSKLKSAGEAGLRADLERLPATASLDELLAAGRSPESQRRARRHSRAVAAAGGDGRRRRAPRVRRRSAGQGRRRLSSGQRRAARAEPRGARRLHAVGRDRAARAIGRSRSPARAPSSSAAATSSASRWRCCCCIATRR